MSLRSNPSNASDFWDGLANPAAAIEPKHTKIIQSLLANSRQVRSPQFETIGVSDLVRLFELYDHEFFLNRLSARLEQVGSPPVVFRLSNRMTRAAGKTMVVRDRRRVNGQILEQLNYQIAISSLLLFQTFREISPNGQPARAIEVAGVTCTNRLAALLRIFEHELVHLAEFLTLGTSNCAATSFRQRSRAIFGHAASVHTLITPVESAAQVFAIALGDQVAFDHSGAEWVGIVRRITRRASILVPDGSGRLFSDGKRYLTFLVPLDQLRKV